MPAGPGADALLASFRAVEKELADHEPGPAKVVTDRQIELLLKKKASVLHLSAANYCWFEDRRRRCVSSSPTPGPLQLR
ncbi:hypothetical protein ABZ553_37060 [Streptomyces sparsogenes]|uniref:hypothetical protein n=1 Tax=Streptomyces sparsogenes TaxID=67365 RepID=UPI00340FD69B